MLRLPVVFLAFLLSTCGGYRGPSKTVGDAGGGDDQDIWFAGDQVNGDNSETGDDDSPEGDHDDSCDLDHDGYTAQSCGGNDCNDENAAIHPGFPELCDFDDNDCDNDINEGIECWFYAHSSTQLFKVDPFMSVITPVAAMESTMWDIDTHPDSGVLYAVGINGLFRFDDTLNVWDTVGGTTGQAGNGFAIDNTGRAFVTNLNQLYLVALDSGSWTMLGDGTIGSDGGLDFISSGDCVVNKDNTLFMTSKHTDTDSLILISSTDWEGSVVGETGYSNIYALTAAWGFMFGLTSNGDLLLINEATGTATLLDNLGETWYGAASTPLSQ